MPGAPSEIGHDFADASILQFEEWPWWRSTHPHRSPLSWAAASPIIPNIGSHMAPSTGIDRIGLEALGDEKAWRLVGRPRRIGRGADDRDRAHARQDFARCLIADAVDCLHLKPAIPA